MGLPLEHGLLFVHTPKTAGTSFREALEQSIGPDHMFFDYGEDNETTTPLVSQYVFPNSHETISPPSMKVANASFHSKRNILELGQVLEKLDKRLCVCGHFSFPKYAALFMARNTITFFRDPVQRFISSYEHQKRFNGLDLSLEAYCDDPQYLNVQSKVVGSYPPGLIGFVGLQEHYSESLQMVEALYDIEVKELLSNVNEKRTQQNYVIDDETLALIKRVNHKDIILQQRIEEIFVQRQALFRAGRSYTHGHIGLMMPKRLGGWAVNNANETAVEIEIKKNGTVIATELANQYRPNLREKNANRLGFIGIDHFFAKPIDKDDVVECVVAETQQVLAGHQQIPD